jgi:hypothetical protein
MKICHPGIWRAAPSMRAMGAVYAAFEQLPVGIGQKFMHLIPVNLLPEMEFGVQ